MADMYLDHAATTPLHPAVLEAMLPYWQSVYGNASSLHRFGRKARQAVTGARDGIADALGCSPGELVFTGGGTESDNMAIFGVAEALRPAGKRHVVTTAIEHHAVLHACDALERRGYEVTRVPVDRSGVVAADAIAAALRADTALVSVMYVNNETGAIQPIEAIGRLCANRGVTFHVDAVQALGVLPIELGALPVDLMSFSAHKINGPKGTGLLYVKHGIKLQPLHYGGVQETGRRPGTENVAGIVGLAAAVALAQAEIANKQQSMLRLRQLFQEAVVQAVGEGGALFHGDADRCAPHIVCVSFPGVERDIMLMNLDLAGIAVSAGSACTAGALEPSHVLAAMGLSDELLRSAIRASFGYGSGETEIVQAAQIMGTIAQRIRM